MMKHTPGPWYRDGTTVYALNPHNFNRFSAQIHGAHTPKSELEAVAQLMQAAPELLEALQDLDALRGPFPPSDEAVDAAWRKASAAIAKATA
ncbi:hypothetical protein IPC755_07035 [Pseudomonas aeruginosa]|uniref:hypothetical protein n=1 Tax=Pseudomonas aeruginosa TaxID=287 RepID=UPI00053E947A|nr:hypothetical protein [Pseudomonas aeruginosa]UVN14188.1 hypothetical protein FBPa47_0063 [Pseudomonas phage vB_PeaS_FBPa47]EKU9103212.1 hypothetical protein [Pseudomonas aeruginosa]MCO3120580.1 hypothetical protein [Pseudomonas aeruginosa]MDJ1511511.1 hypothetical protein [Pseudomonas aeruginosa]MDV6927538.1 hypothetical protein [Pseudomonas aeruginosa]